jgi:hypothetical protein
MTQYLRFCQITADGGAGTIDVSTLRCRFYISQGTMLTPSILKLEVSNILPATAQRFAHKEFAHIKIDAGYQDGHGIIFQGNIKQAIYGRKARPTRFSRSMPPTATTGTITRQRTPCCLQGRRRSSI